MLYEVKNVSLAVPFDSAFDYISDKLNLPEWTNAFAEVKANGDAIMRTPVGEVKVHLDGTLDRSHGIIDTKMRFPDDSVGLAHSRLIALDNDSCVYSFVLTPPPVALEELEGTLAQQSEILEQELQILKSKLEG